MGKTGTPAPRRMVNARLGPPSLRRCGPEGQEGRHLLSSAACAAAGKCGDTTGVAGRRAPLAATRSCSGFVTLLSGPAVVGTQAVLFWPKSGGSRAAASTTSRRRRSALLLAWLFFSRRLCFELSRLGSSRGVTSREHAADADVSRQPAAVAAAGVGHGHSQQDSKD